MRAADLFEPGVIPAEIARRVGDSHQIVSDWRVAWRRLAGTDSAAQDELGRLPN
jgi:transposase-like protein